MLAKRHALFVLVQTNIGVASDWNVVCRKLAVKLVQNVGGGHDSVKQALGKQLIVFLPSMAGALRNVASGWMRHILQAGFTTTILAITSIILALCHLDQGQTFLSTHKASRHKHVVGNQRFCFHLVVGGAGVG